MPNRIISMPRPTGQPTFADAPSMTARELQVAELATLRNIDIGLALGISDGTVRAHLASIARKTGLETRAAIAVMADRLTRKAA